MTGNESRVSRRDAIKILGTGAITSGFLTSCNVFPSANAQKQNTVTVWYFPFGNGVEQLYGQFAQEFEKEYPDIKIDLQLQPFNNRNQALLTALTANQGPDVFYMTTDPLIWFAEVNAITPLDDLLPKNIWDGIITSSVDEVAYQGEHWYLPIWHELPIWLYIPSLLQMTGRNADQPPTTWNDMVNMCRQAKTQGIYGWGYNAASVTLNDTFYPFLYQAGGRPFSADGKQAAFNSAAGVEALTFIRELFREGWAPQADLNAMSTLEEDLFFQKKEVVSIEYRQNTLIAAQKQFPELNVQVLPVPKHKEQWGFGALAGWSITSGAKNKEATALWLSFLGRPEIALRHCQSFGYIPVNKQASGGAFKNNPQVRAVSSEIIHTFGEQKNRHGRDIMPLVLPEIQAAIIGQKTPKQALDDAAVIVNQILANG